MLQHWSDHGNQFKYQDKCSIGGYYFALEGLLGGEKGQYEGQFIG
jgi:hypothetical protein